MLVVYSFNLLIHADPEMRFDVLDLYMKHVDFTAKIGVKATIEKKSC